MMMDMPGVAQSDIGLEIDGTVVRVNCEYKVPDELQTDKARTHRVCAALLVAHAHFAGEVAPRRPSVRRAPAQVRANASQSGTRIR